MMGTLESSNIITAEELEGQVYFYKMLRVYCSVEQKARNVIKLYTLHILFDIVCNITFFVMLSQ